MQKGTKKREFYLWKNVERSPFRLRIQDGWSCQLTASCCSFVRSICSSAFWQAEPVQTIRQFFRILRMQISS